MSIAGTNNGAGVVVIDTTPEELLAATDPLTGLDVLDAGSMDAVSSSGYSRAIGMANIALFGDSNTANMINESATVKEHQAFGYGSYIAPVSMQRVQVAWNDAVGGAMVLPTGVFDSLTRQIDDFIASDAASTVNGSVVMFGTNDIVSAPSAVAAALFVQIKRLRRFGTVNLMTVPPAAGATNTNATYDAGTVRWQWILRYNALLRQIARENPGWIRLIDVHAIGVDPASATAVAKTNYIYDSATVGLHISNYFAALIGSAIASALTKDLPDQYDWLTSAADLSTLTASALEPSVQILTNGLITAGAPTGTGWALTNGSTATHTPTIVTHPNGYGNCQKIAGVFPASNDRVFASNSGWSARVSNGDRLFAQMWVRIPAGVICAPTLFMSMNFAGVSNSVACLSNVTGKEGKNLPAMDLLLRTPVLTVPSSGAITGADLQLISRAKDTGSGDIIFGQAEVRKIVTML